MSSSGRSPRVEGSMSRSGAGYAIVWGLVAVVAVAAIGVALWFGGRAFWAANPKASPPLASLAVKSPSPTPSAKPSTDGTVSVWFVAGEDFERVDRPVSASQDRIEAAMTALAEGPTDSEAARGLDTYVPSGTELVNVSATPSGASGRKAVTVRFNNAFLGVTSTEPADAALEYVARIAQVGYTMSQFKNVTRTTVKAGTKSADVPSVAEIAKATSPEPAIPDLTASAPAASTTARASSITDAQKRLVAMKYLPPEAVTGKNDYRTKQAVMAFQAWAGLSRRFDRTRHEGRVEQRFSPHAQTGVALERSSGSGPSELGRSAVPARRETRPGDTHLDGQARLRYAQGILQGQPQEPDALVDPIQGLDAVREFLLPGLRLPSGRRSARQSRIPRVLPSGSPRGEMGLSVPRDGHAGQSLLDLP